jgi:hypothetical protein
MPIAGMNPLGRIRCLLAALWAGSLWTSGYLVAPTLFATLADRVLAGTVAASMFRSQAWLSIACALLLLLLLRFGAPQKQRTLLVLVLAMLACTLVVHVGLQPMMAALREAAGPGGVMESSARTRFGVLHGISSLIFMLQSVLGGVLVWKMS